VLINLQFMFGDKKVPAALGLMIPMVHTSLFPCCINRDRSRKCRFKNKVAQKIYNLQICFKIRCSVAISKYVDVLEKKEYHCNNVKVVPRALF
jgi:hypothetical protein